MDIACSGSRKVCENQRFGNELDSYSIPPGGGGPPPPRPHTSQPSRCTAGHIDRCTRHPHRIMAPVCWIIGVRTKTGPWNAEE